MTILYVAHVSASGRLDLGWDFIADEHRVDAVIRLGTVPVHLSIHVCSRENPRLGAHPLQRIDGESFRVLPERYVRAFPNRIETLQPIRCPIGDILAVSEQLQLTHCTDAVVAELEKL